MSEQDLHIRKTSAESDTDVDRKISERLLSIIESATGLPTKTDVSLFVRNRVVTVSGGVLDKIDHVELISRIRETPGVKRIIDRLTDRQ